MKKGRFLAVDYGSKNIGLAASDELGVVVRPLPSIPCQSRRNLLSRLASLVEENRIDSIVIGLPLNMDGTSGKAVEKVRHFTGQLRHAVSLPLIEFDERLSTVEAGELWREMNARQQRRYRTIDSLAAALILQRFLEES